MTLTTQEIYDLDNSMVALQAINGGELLSALSNSIVTSGSVVPVAADTVIDTGLGTVLGCVCSMSGSPTSEHTMSTITTGSVAGTVILSCWKPSSASVTTLTSASANLANVRWMAVGTLE